MTRFLFLLSFILGGWQSLLLAQVQVEPQPGDSSTRTVQILNADRYGYKRVDSVTEIQTLAGHVQLQQGSTLFYCDSAIYNKNLRQVEAFGHVHINDNDSVHTYSDYLLYHADTRIAHLQKAVKLTDGKSTLLTDDLQYDLNQKIGDYKSGGKVINGKSVLTSRQGTYYADTKDVYFMDNVLLDDPQYKLSTDTLLYNSNTQIATFMALTHITDSANRKIATREGYYDMKNKKSFLSSRSSMEDGAVRVLADSIQTDDSTGISILVGNAVYIDSAQGVSVLANRIEANRSESSFLATQRPLMIIRQDRDSIYLTADSLYSGRLSRLRAIQDSLRKEAATQLTNESGGLIKAGDNDSTLRAANKPLPLSRRERKQEKNEADSSSEAQSIVIVPAAAEDSLSFKNDSAIRKPLAKATIIAVKDTANLNKNDSADRYFNAWHHVRIFSDSLQAVADSLFYSGEDSVFRLYQNPVLWASGNQVTGDSIFLYTKNKKPDQLYVSEHGMAINKAGDNMFNQVKGNRLYGYFEDGNIERMQAKGGAQSVYYVKDDKDYLVGVNKAAGDIIELRFKNKELNRVVFISAVTGTMYPVRGISNDEKLLQNFQWLEEQRPKSKYELFGD